MLPAILIFSIFFITPTIISFVYSFTDWDGLSQSFNFVGFANFKRAITADRRAMEALVHTFQYSAIICIIQNFFGLMVALLIDRKFFLRNFSKAIFFMPNVFNALIIGYVWSYIYDPNFGVLTNFLEAIGLQNIADIVWLGDKNYVIWGISLTVIWQFTGTSMIMYLAGLQSISPELYEAAYIDGAGTFQKFKEITFPLLAPAFTINIVWSFIGTMKIFDYIFIMTSGGPGDASQSISTLLYDYAFTKSKFGYGSALGILLFIIIGVFSVTMTVLLRKREVDV